MPAPIVSADAYQAALRVAIGAARSAADRHRDRFMADANVVDVRPGFKFTDGWITDTPAVVVTVLRKGDPATLGSRPIEAELDGIPVDVAPATPRQQLHHLAGTAGPGSRSAISPSQLAALAPMEELLEPGDAPAVAEATRAGTTGRQYREPSDLALAAARGPMTLLCHASPDAGWPTLRTFLGGTRQTLTVAMYDFGAKHIVEAIESAMRAAPGHFVLNLDRRSNPSRAGELTEEQVVKRFANSLKERFESSTAAVGVLYPNAYHIKVAVRDGSAFWLSSGNWQRTNQPPVNATDLDEAAQRELFSNHNREWHVVCDSARLAKTFEAYIGFDVAEAARVAERGVIPPPLPDLFRPPAEALRAAARPVKVFKAKKFSLSAAERATVQPVLTPDNYGEHVVPLIKSAKKTLYFQNQYIQIPKTFPDGAGKPGLKELAEALRDRIAAGVDVRIILRNGGDARGMLQALKVFGIDPARVRLLGGCHNKGIVADSKAVLVSSQNYSADGVRFNRDAGLVIRHAGAAAYFEQIFLHDWDNRATQRIAGETGGMPLVPAVAGGTRSAAASMAWDDWYGD